jgi:uncharacterized protein (TIGR02996 family)
MTDTDTGTALLAAVRATPADDTVRLVYADWLEEQGEELRAEFIRATCAGDFGNLPAGSLVREGALAQAKANGVEWFGPFGVVCLRRELFQKEMTGGSVALVRRGFVEEVRAPADWWLAHGDAVTARHPVRAVRLTTLPQVYHRRTGNDWSDFAAGFQDDPRGVCFPYESVAHGEQSLYRARWPGVAFELPPERDVTVEDFNAITGRIMAGLWVDDLVALGREMETLRSRPPFPRLGPPVERGPFNRSE